MRCWVMYYPVMTEKICNLLLWAFIAVIHLKHIQSVLAAVCALVRNENRQEEDRKKMKRAGLTQGWASCWENSPPIVALQVPYSETFDSKDLRPSSMLLEEFYESISV